jgi:DNA-binding GntR family transcriptional regulator
VAARAKLSAEVEESESGTRLSDVAYTRILETLFDRRIPTGAFVSQNELVDLLGIPIAAVRDALKMLESEGIVAIHPRSGIQFVKPGLELVRSTYQYRAILERAAVAVYAETGDEAELAEIEHRHLAAIDEVERLGLTDHARVELDDLEVVLHNAVIHSLGNPLIDRAYQRIHNYLRIIRLDRKLTPPLALRSLREHMQIILACKSRDPVAAVAALQTHFNAAMQRNMGLY